MIWVFLAIVVILWINGLWKNAAQKRRENAAQKRREREDAARKRARRCHHGVLGGDCPRCQQEIEELIRIAKAEAKAEAWRLENLDQTFFGMDEATKMKIIDMLEKHRIDANLPAWTPYQMKQAVVQVYRRSLANEGKPMTISGASIRRGKS